MNRIVAGYQAGPYVLKKQQAFTKMDSVKTRWVFKILFLGAFVVFLSLFYIWSRVQIVSVGYQINALEKKQDKLKNDNKLLQMELSLMTSPTRIENFASSKLKMQLPNQDQIIKVE